MARSAMGKLSEAKELQKQSNDLKKSDPQAAVELAELAHRKRMSAVKQMKRRPKKISGLVRG